jgi:hypothetical protein
MEHRAAIPMLLSLLNSFLSMRSNWLTNFIIAGNGQKHNAHYATDTKMTQKKLRPTFGHQRMTHKSKLAGCVFMLL